MRSPGVSAGKQMVRVKRCHYGTNTFNMRVANNGFNWSNGFTAIALEKHNNVSISCSRTLLGWLDASNVVELAHSTLANNYKRLAIIYKVGGTNYIAQWPSTVQYDSNTWGPNCVAWTFTKPDQYYLAGGKTTGSIVASGTITGLSPNPPSLVPTWLYLWVYNSDLNFNHRGFHGPVAIFSEPKSPAFITDCWKQMWDLEKVHRYDATFCGYWKCNQRSSTTVIPNEAPYPIQGDATITTWGDTVWRYSPLEML